MKNAVLDDVVASKFSTAAAIANKRSEQGGVDWRDNTLATASPPREANKASEEVGASKTNQPNKDAQDDEADHKLVEIINKSIAS